MTAPLTTLRAKLTPSEPHRYLADDLFEYLFSPRGQETLGLVAIAAGCLGLVYVLGR